MQNCLARRGSGNVSSNGGRGGGGGGGGGREDLPHYYPHSLAETFCMMLSIGAIGRASTDEPDNS